jgi:hypothetical protein
VARAKGKRSRRLVKVHDRRSHDLPLNAEVAPVEVDDPLALEPGDKIVALRSIRNDPLGRLHHTSRSTTRNIGPGAPSRAIGNALSAGLRLSTPPANMSTARRRASRSPRLNAGPCCGSIASNASSAPMAPRWSTMC